MDELEEIQCSVVLRWKDDTGGMTTETAQRVIAAWMNWKNQTGFQIRGYVLLQSQFLLHIMGTVSGNVEWHNVTSVLSWRLSTRHFQMYLTIYPADSGLLPTPSLYTATFRCFTHYDVVEVTVGLYFGSEQVNVDDDDDEIEEAAG